DPSWCQRPSQRQLRIDGGNVRDRGLLEVEHDLVLAWIRDLQDSAAVSVVHEERLISLAAEHRRGPVEAEQVCRDPRSLVRGELRECRVEYGTHGGPDGIRPHRGATGSSTPGRAFKDPSSERIGSPFRGRIVTSRAPTLRPLNWRLLRLVLRHRA